MACHHNLEKLQGENTTASIFQPSKMNNQSSKSNRSALEPNLQESNRYPQTTFSQDMSGQSMTSAMGLRGQACNHHPPSAFTRDHGRQENPFKLQGEGIAAWNTSQPVIVNSQNRFMRSAPGPSNQYPPPAFLQDRERQLQENLVKFQGEIAAQKEKHAILNCENIYMRSELGPSHGACNQYPPSSLSQDYGRREIPVQVQGEIAQHVIVNRFMRSAPGPNYQIGDQYQPPPLSQDHRSQQQKYPVKFQGEIAAHKEKPVTVNRPNWSHRSARDQACNQYPPSSLPQDHGCHRRENPFQLQGESVRNTSQPIITNNENRYMRSELEPSPEACQQFQPSALS